MEWINFKEDKEKPKDGSWVIIQSSLEYVPKFEVCYYKDGEWYLPANDDSCFEDDIVKWTYIEG
jgi:hypothetical protein